MQRISWFYLIGLIVLFSISVNASQISTLNTRLGIKPSPTNQTSNNEKQQQTIELSIQQLKEQADSYQQAQVDFERLRTTLNAELNKPKSPLTINSKTKLSEQASTASVKLSSLKDLEAELSQQISELLSRHNQLPEHISHARNALAQHKKAPLAPIGTPNGQRQQNQRQLYQQTLDTLEADFSSNPNRLIIAQLRLKLVRAQLAQQEKLIEKLNNKIGAARQKNTTETIAKNLSSKGKILDPIAEELSNTNRLYAQRLQSLTLGINSSVKRQEQAENLYQVQTRQLDNIKEQISWVKLNSAFGEHFLKTLESLAPPPNLNQLQSTISSARLAKYHLEQQQIINHQQLEQNTELSTQHLKLIQSQLSLIKQLQKEYVQYLNELAKLKVIYTQLTDQYSELSNLLNEQLFWVPNAPRIGQQWFIDIGTSIKLLANEAPWGDFKFVWVEQQNYWSWWIIVLTLCLIIQDLNRNRFRTHLRENLVGVGNVTQDKFSSTFKTLLITLSYSLLKPISIVLAGYLLYLSEHNIVHATGGAVLGVGLFYLLQRLCYVMSLPEGLLIGHFKSSEQMIVGVYGFIKRFYYLNIILVACISFTQLLDLSILRNSIGRGAFILICLLLFFLLRNIDHLMKYHKLQSGNTNKRLLQKLLWSALRVSPIIAAVLSYMGYYFTAFQMLMQLTLSVFIGLGFLLIYQLIKRWMLIERRRIAFERAKARRAELLSQREKGETNVADSGDTYEEPEVDLETISSQSLGLVRSLLLLGLLASVVGLWTQTHSALFSFFDGITLWTTHASINGIEQQLPISLKSVLYGLIMFGFSMMIAANLPGLLELTILQRLELSSGTGYAITTVSRYLVLFVGMLIGFNILGVEWSKLQWLIAALSVGLGFGLQEIFANFISGLIILFEKPVRIGDTVTIRELTGTVSKIKIRATTIIDWDRKEIIVPNKAFITEQLINWSLSDPITRVTITVSTARDSDPAKVEAALYQAVRECPHTLQNPSPEVWFSGFGQHTQDYQIRAYATDMSSRWPLRHELHKLITQKLRDNDLVIAYPQLEIHINNGQSTEPTSVIRGV
ncbi:mechanosensitive ion channel protein MscS [Parashewanella spongiae]|uniref:Mechanosensitive ion channel protein MscS n=1 Tax=Parashewanella spongiae TaxID=342950 RepID=A0A3A6TT32_9GAMM|nr:mechanosensitive ion channel domain-containing protein [Parashewanella spongiae]MCL1078825.1 mechanosensitive ion channel [Parashewanella spongiae]RJY11896.1 mechanosensitive ion channel protein MscS [Parashewanella spongiae]